MKKIFSLLLVVAMIASLSVVSFAATANAAGGMHTVITESDTDITVDVYVNNYDSMTSVVNYLLFDKVTCVENSIAANETFSAWTFNKKINTDGVKLEVISKDSNADNRTGETMVAFSYKVTKNDPSYELSESDFAYGTKSLKGSKIVTLSTGSVAGVADASGTKFTCYGTAAPYFTVEYVDARTPITPDEPDDVVVEEETFAEGLTSADVTEGNITYGDYGAAMAEGGKVYTYFAKNVNALKANAYGITAMINGVEYKFPGKADVEAGKNWAIKLIIPAGSFADTAITSVSDFATYGNN